MILNLTQHYATEDQIKAGVYDLQGEALPDSEEVNARAEKIAAIASQTQKTGLVMIGGALWLMYPLIKALVKRGLTPLFAYSERETVEEPQEDGSVKKIAVFRHKGFVPAW